MEGSTPWLELLLGISGAFRPKVLTCLMGVTGAGKTTLMDVLAGRKTGQQSTLELCAKTKCSFDENRPLCLFYLLFHQVNTMLYPLNVIDTNCIDATCTCTITHSTQYTAGETLCMSLPHGCIGWQRHTLLRPLSVVALWQKVLAVTE